MITNETTVRKCICPRKLRDLRLQLSNSCSTAVDVDRKVRVETAYLLNVPPKMSCMQLNVIINVSQNYDELIHSKVPE